MDALHDSIHFFLLLKSWISLRVGRISYGLLEETHFKRHFKRIGSKNQINFNHFIFLKSCDVNSYQFLCKILCWDLRDHIVSFIGLINYLHRSCRCCYCCCSESCRCVVVIYSNHGTHKIALDVIISMINILLHKNKCKDYHLLLFYCDQLKWLLPILIRINDGTKITHQIENKNVLFSMEIWTTSNIDSTQKENVFIDKPKKQKTKKNYDIIVCEFD